MGNSLSVCKTRADDITIIFEDGTISTIPSRNIYYYSIEKDFFNDFLPILNIKCLVTRDIYTKVNKQVAKFKVSIKKFFINSDNTTFNKQDKNIMYKRFIDNVFINVNNTDSSIDPSKALVDDIEKISERNELEKTTVELDLLLFTEESLNYRKLNDKIFQDANMFNTILALSQLTEQGKLLITYPDNRELYKDNDIIIPNNLTFIGCIKYLQSVYGIYNKGYILFRDYDRTYLIDKDLSCNAYAKGEYKRVYISFSQNNDPKGNVYGQYDNIMKRIYNINCINAPKIITNSTASNELLFDNLYVTNTYTGETNVTNVNMRNSSKTKTTKIVENKYNNDYIVNSSAYEITLNNYTITTTFNEADLDIFTPNKEYYLDNKMDIKEYRQLNGLMKLSRIMAIYEKTTSNDEDIFTGVINAEFKRA